MPPHKDVDKIVAETHPPAEPAITLWFPDSSNLSTIVHQELAREEQLANSSPRAAVSAASGRLRTEGGQLLPGSVIRHYRRGHLVLPGVLPGVTWSVTWCYLVLPGVTWSVTWCYLGVAWCYRVLPGFLFWSSFFVVVPKYPDPRSSISTLRCHLAPRL